ncbi:MAG TPA: haloacid dehalogenase-like hydrolase [Pseudonocardiaceae bacterium]|nr:haloacid dehalogenase-like hydrolase [Pseudonocardiaceae bacterium]
MTIQPEPVVRPSWLVLWDIDLTLVATPGLGRRVYADAFDFVLHRPLTELASTAGRTELDIMAETLVLNGITPTDALFAALADGLVAAFRAAQVDMAATGHALPGAQPTLAWLAGQSAVHQSVLTGNLREVARLKLDTFGLADYVDLAAGAYGGDNADRAALVPLAQARAAERTGVSFDGTTTVLIGDTPLDVAAALAAGTRVIAVATGHFSADELRAAGAHEVINDLTECPAVLRRLVRGRTEPAD